MSDQPAIPAITVFPPFNPAPRRDEPAHQPARDAAREPAPPAAEQAEPVAEAPAEPRAAERWDAAPTSAPMPWDFEAPAPEPEAPAAGADGALEIGDEDEDLPWLEVPTPRAPEGTAQGQEIRADDTPNFMDWIRTDDQLPPVAETEDADDADDGAPPIEDFVADAQPWAPEVENAADNWVPEQPAEPWKAEADSGQEEPWKAPDTAGEEPWQAPHDAPADDWAAPADAPAGHPWEAPATPDEPTWDAPADVDVPEPELYDLPDVPAAPWTAAEAPLFEAPGAGAEPEPAWELPADAAASPAAESTGAWTAPEGQLEPTPAGQAAASAPHADVSGAFAQVADRLQAIAGALRSDPAAFLAGAQGGGDPLALLVTGFVLGYQAGQGGNG
ncbi:MAG TPA: hypothetical protein VGB15_12230 [Longimicrobium sp.]|jgi:hypothetical protein